MFTYICIINHGNKGIEKLDIVIYKNYILTFCLAMISCMATQTIHSQLSEARDATIQTEEYSMAEVEQVIMVLKEIKFI